MDSTGMSFTMYLRADTTLTTISGDNVTIFELENRANVIIGILSRKIDDQYKLIKIPVFVKVHTPVNKSFFSGVKPMEAIEITSNDFNVSLGLPLSESIRLNRPDGTNFVLNDKRSEEKVEGYNILEDALIVQDEIGIYDSKENKIIPSYVEIGKIREARLYYKVNFHLIEDIGHLKGDHINILLSNRILIDKWIRY